MALSQRLNLKQSQSLVMTPQLVQSIKLLQLNSLELTEFVQAEIERNPLLEIDANAGGETRRESQQENADQSEKTSVESAGTEASDLVTGDMQVDAAQRNDAIDTSFDNVYDKGTVGDGATPTQSKDQMPAPDGLSSRGASASHDGSGDDLAAWIGEEVSLVRHLEMQIACAFKAQTDRDIATFIAHGLDEDGYFREDFEDVVKRLGCDRDQFEWVLERFQEFEPVGIGARNLAECLTIQLKELNRFDPAIAGLISNLDLLAKRDFPTLMQRCNVDVEDLKDMIFEIKSLDPRPARQFESRVAETVVPDVMITGKADGSWGIELNSETLPKVLVNKQYYSELNTQIDSEEGKEFITDCLNNANWLVRSLDQRANTILKVATEIVRQQDMFFAEGVEHLKPMTLKKVAEAIKMHESTISRVTSNKYLTCDRGVFELKYFFSAAISNAEGDDEVAAEAVRHKIKQLVDAEDVKKILSDEAIVDQLQSIGIDIARRTVAKYREAMAIPSSVQRRREKQASLTFSA